MKDKKGFTLVEVIISIAALGIICAVLLRLFVLAGATSDRAVDIQEAGLDVTSTIEMLACADTLSAGLAGLGISCPAETSEGSFVYSRGGCEITINVSESGDYPGMLCEITVSASKGGKVLSSLNTAKYYKEQGDD